jgi:Flp pilus assembly protein TadG
MLLRKHAPRRPGTAMTEAGLILTAFLFLLFAIIVGGLGVFRYQQLATLSRLGARFASVHGSQYVAEYGSRLPLQDQAAIQTYLRNQAVGLDPSQLNVQVQLSTSSGTVGWDAGGGAVATPVATTSGAAASQRTSTVTVTVTYRWMPEVGFLGVGPLNLSSSTAMPMAF